jgi:ATP phosphoribosyltransferase regulatory subunit
MVKNFPDGVRDLTSEDLQLVEETATTIRRLFQSYGYRSVQTPSFESYDLYHFPGAPDRNSMLKCIDASGRVLVLRPDATVPLARMVAMNYPQENSLRFSYQTTIFRKAEAGVGDLSEWHQAGIETFGDATPEVDAEVISIGVEALLALQLSNLHFDLGHAGFLAGLFESLSLQKEQEKELMGYVESKNLPELEQAIRTWDLSEEGARALLRLPQLYGQPQAVLKEARSLCLNKQMEDAVSNLAQVVDNLKDLIDVPLQLDLGFTNRMHYYTGLIFKGYMQNAGTALVSGGRYNDLSTQFGPNRPACGFGLNLSYLSSLLPKAIAQVPEVVRYSKESRKLILQKAKVKRQNGSIVITLSEGANSPADQEVVDLRNLEEAIQW